MFDEIIRNLIFFFFLEKKMKKKKQIISEDLIKEAARLLKGETINKNELLAYKQHKLSKKNIEDYK